MTCERGFELEQFNTARIWGTESRWQGKLHLHLELAMHTKAGHLALSDQA